MVKKIKKVQFVSLLRSSRLPFYFSRSFNTLLPISIFFSTSHCTNSCCLSPSSSHYLSLILPFLHHSSIKNKSEEKNRIDMQKRKKKSLLLQVMCSNKEEEICFFMEEEERCCLFMGNWRRKHGYIGNYTCH